MTNISASQKPFEALGNEFSDVVTPADFPETKLRYRNQRAAETVGLDHLSDEDWISHFARFKPLPDNMPEPRAIRYHGHQFGQYNPEIGDGRGFLFAQLKDNTGRLLDLGTKGSGQTPFSRFGDGRLTLKGGVREILATEMLEASGVYTSKTFSIIETGEPLHRNDEPSPTRSAVMVRLQHSHVRFGAFQRLAYLEEKENLLKLITHVRDNYYPDIETDDPKELAPQILSRIAEATAKMIASWMAAGFVHGVMNTDNMNVTGETFDFGPYRFLPESNPGFTAAYFDEGGRYAFGRQPSVGLWNLQQLAGTFTLVCEAEPLSQELSKYAHFYQAALHKENFFQLGITPQDVESDLKFLTEMFTWMTETKIPWHQFFFDWFGGAANDGRALESPFAHLYSAEDFAPIRHKLTAFEPDRPERLDHAYFQKPHPETLLIDEIEALWKTIADDDDWNLFEAKLNGIAMKREALLA